MKNKKKKIGYIKYCKSDLHIDIHFYCLTYEGGKTKWKKTQIKMLRKTHRKI